MGDSKRRGGSGALAVPREAGALAKQLWAYLRNQVILGPGYPRELMFTHSVRAVVSWRAFCLKHDGGKPVSWVYHVVCAFLCHGFGGTHVRDLVMAQTPSLFTNKELPAAWLLACACVYLSPFDVVFALVNTPCTLTSLAVTTFEAVDSATTVTGSVDKARRLFPDSPGAPVLAAVLAGIGGSVFRFIERREGRGWADEHTEWAAPTEAFRRTLLYTVTYMLLSRKYGRDRARLWVATFHILWSLSKELSGAPLDFTRVLPL